MRQLERLARFFQSVPEQVLLWAEAVDIVEGVAKCAFADASRTTEIGDEGWTAGVLAYDGQCTPDNLRMRETRHVDQHTDRQRSRLLREGPELPEKNDRWG